MTIRDFQYWILLLGSVIVGVLLLVQIPLTHYLFADQERLTDFRDEAQLEPGYEKLCRELAYRIYQVGRDNDPAMLDVLKSEHIQIQPGPGADTNAIAAPAAPTPQNPPGPEVAPVPAP